MMIILNLSINQIQNYCLTTRSILILLIFTKIKKHLILKKVIKLKELIFK